MVEGSDVPIVRLFIPSEEDEQALVNLGELIGVETKRPTETQDALPSNGFVLFSTELNVQSIVFSYDVTAATLVSKTNPVGVELRFLCEWFIQLICIDAGYVSENALLQERALAIFQNWPGRPGHDKHDSDGFFRTLRVDLPFAFFSEANKRRLYQNCVKPLRSPQPNFWTSQSCFLSSNLWGPHWKPPWRVGLPL